MNQAFTFKFWNVYGSEFIEKEVFDPILVDSDPTHTTLLVKRFF